MMRSLYSGISGLRNHQTRMDVIGNNIANVNTAGYKTSRVIFQDIFSQNVASGMGNQGLIGGTNPIQVGLGIRLATVDVIHSRAAFQRTDREVDMMINGDGYFIVAQINAETGQFEPFYTRAGNFDIDNEGYLVNSQGLYVLGRSYELTMGVVDPGSIIALEARPRLTAGQFAPGDDLPTENYFRIGDVIPLGTFTTSPASASTTGPTTITAANIADWNNNTTYTVAAAPANWPTADRPAVNAIEVVPRPQINTGTFGTTPPAIPTVPMNYFRIGDVIPLGTFTNPPASASTTGPTTITADNLADWNDNVQRIVDAAPSSWPAVTRPAVNMVFSRDPVFGLVPSVDYLPGNENGLSRVRVTAVSTVLPKDPNTGLPTGYPVRTPGQSDAAYAAVLEGWVNTLNDTEEVGLPGFSVANNGDISVILGNRKVVIARLAIGMFSNPSGLEKAGNSLYRESASSGPVVTTEAYSDGAGKIDGGGLEMSNVDLANEFTDMIVTQRGFQANSRIITVSDTLLEELVNLKR